MTEQQYKFFVMLDSYPQISRFWSLKTMSLDIPELKNSLLYLNQYECHMAKFFASVWLNESESFPFDILDSLHYIDLKGKNTILQWLIEPYYP